MQAPTRPDPAWLDSQYNNRALVPEFGQHLQRWQADSALARQRLAPLCDLAYGDGPAETLDLFPASRAAGQPLAPVLVFIHGGYWRSLDKADHSFLAAPFVAQGACVVVPNYALCPAVSIPDITLQMVRAVAWVWRHIEAHGGDPRRITLAGHSAGGHLVAMLLACEWRRWAPDLPPDLVKNGLSISGVFDLEPLRHAPFVRDALQLTPAQVRRASPVRLTPPPMASGRGARGALACVAGGEESAEFRRQNGLLRKAWGAKRVPVCESLPGLNHFSVLEALIQPGHRLHALAQRLLAA